MTGRYVTEAERAGAKERQRAYRARVAAAGKTDRIGILTDGEQVVLKEILSVWRGQYKGELNDRVRSILALKPSDRAESN